MTHDGCDVKDTINARPMRSTISIKSGKQKAEKGIEYLIDVAAFQFISTVALDRSCSYG